MHRNKIGLSYLWVSAMLILGLVVLSGLTSIPANAAASTLYVSNSNPTCAGKTPCYSTIQAAVDAAANGDEIRVAAGTYSGSQNRTGADGYTYKQVVFIAKSLTVSGGYHPTTWAGPDPAAHPTVIDALRQGRGVTVLGNGTQQVTLQALTIQGGDYTDLGNPAGIANQACNSAGSDCGGGLFVHSAQITLKDSLVRDNIASTKNYSQGGGIFLWYATSGSQVENTQVIGNRLLGQGQGGLGGGMLALFSDALTIERSIFVQNWSIDIGGGLVIEQNKEPVKVEDCFFAENTAVNTGGGIEFGVTYNGVAIELERVTMLNNQADVSGAAIELIKWGSNPSTVKMHNLLMGGNTTNGSPGSGASMFRIQGGSGAQLDVELKHLTLANLPAKSALQVVQSYNRIVNIDLKNTLIDNVYYAFSAEQTNGTINITHDYTLTNNINTLHYTIAGTPNFQSSHLLSGDPKLTSAYHLGLNSAAFNAGMDAGVVDDVDGDPRPLRAGFDIGADEFMPRVYLPLATRN